MAKKTDTHGALPCPYCGGTDLALDEVAMVAIVYVLCRKCSSSGPAATVASLAVEKWNEMEAHAIAATIREGVTG